MASRFFPLFSGAGVRYRREHVHLWWDNQAILPGDDFRRLLESEIDESAVALLLIRQEFLSAIEQTETVAVVDRAANGLK
jgi:hypothetical protein